MIPRSSSSWTGAPVYGSWLLPFAVLEVVGLVDEVTASVKGRAEEPFGFVVADATFGATVVVVVEGCVVVVVEVVDVVDVVVVVVVVVVVLVVLVVEVVVVEVVVVVGGGQSSIDERMPSRSFQGFGPTRTSAWMTPQNGGNGTLNVPEVPTSTPTTGLPTIIGSFTKSIH